MISTHMRALACAGLSLAIAEPAHAECGTLQDCLASAKAQLVQTVETMGPGDCANNAQGCVVVRKNNDQSGFEATLPPNARFTAWPLNGKIQNTLYSRSGSPLPLISVADLQGVTGDVGITVAVQFYRDSSHRPNRQGLFSISDDNAPRMAISADQGHLFYGTQSSYSRSWTDIPLWDPKPGATGWFTLFATFTDGGQLLVELFDNNSDSGGRPQRLTSGRLDFGWPIEAFPKHFDAKTFLKASRLSLGEANGGLVDGFAKMMVFKRPLTERERRAIAVSALKSNPIEFDDPVHACNTGAYLNDRSWLDSAVRTVCGNLGSPLADEAISGVYRLWQPDTALYATDSIWNARRELRLTNKNVLFTNEQRINFERLGANFYRLKMERGAWQVNGTEVATGAVRDKDASQVWHIHRTDRAGIDPTWEIRSALTGTLVGAVALFQGQLLVDRGDWTEWSTTWEADRETSTASDATVPAGQSPQALDDFDDDAGR